jgi:cyclic pyranopterin phosphate synthase
MAARSPARRSGRLHAAAVKAAEAAVRKVRRRPQADTPDDSQGRAVLSHVDSRGRVQMVDVGGKPATAREAVARGAIAMSDDARRLVRSGAVKKGDPLQAARLAGIMAAKQTAALIPLCHPLPITSIEIDIKPTAAGYDVESRVRTTAQTGVEMEALTAVAVALLTIYDMVKAADKTMVLSDIRLMFKSGGRSGTYVRSAPGAKRIAANLPGRRPVRRR